MSNGCAERADARRASSCSLRVARRRRYGPAPATTVIFAPAAPPISPHPLVRAAAALALAVAASAAVGCTPSIGDKCTLSTDCSIQGNRVCDTSQPSGYCTVLGCTPDTCPDNAACVQLGASVPGCPYNDYNAPSRVGSTLCMKTCNSSSDCRQGDGYVCADLCPTASGASAACDPNANPWHAVPLDMSRSRKVCIVPQPVTSPPASPSSVDAQVCSPGP